MSTGIGGHQSAHSRTDEWLTPPEILRPLGQFDLDPSSAIGQLWMTASTMYTVQDDGLSKPWFGRVWLNPPYARKIGKWMDRLASHGNGIALTFARTDTAWFHRAVWGKADAVLFLRGRIRFMKPDGSRPIGTCGGPSVLIAYGKDNVASLERSGLAGAFLAIPEQLKTRPELWKGAV